VVRVTGMVWWDYLLLFMATQLLLASGNLSWYLSSLRYFAVTSWPLYHWPCRHLNTLPASSMPAVLMYTVPSSLCVSTAMCRMAASAHLLSISSLTRVTQPGPCCNTSNMCLTFRQLVGGASGAATCFPRGKAQPCQPTTPWVVGTCGQGLLEDVGVE